MTCTSATCMRRFVWRTRSTRRSGMSRRRGATASRSPRSRLPSTRQTSHTPNISGPGGRKNYSSTSEPSRASVFTSKRGTFTTMDDFSKRNTTPSSAEPSALRGICPVRRFFLSTHPYYNTVPVIASGVLIAYKTIYEVQNAAKAERIYYQNLCRILPRFYKLPVAGFTIHGYIGCGKGGCLHDLLRRR